MSLLSNFKKYLIFLIVFLSFMNHQNIDAKVIYDKSGIIITDIDLQSYAEIYKQSNNIELRPNIIIKRLVLQKNILNDLEENNPEYLLELDRKIFREFGEENYNNNFVRDFIRFQKLKDEFIFDYYNNNLDIKKFKDIMMSFEELRLPLSNNNCLTILQIIDLKSNENFIENFFSNLKNNTVNYSVNLNNEIYQVCLNDRHIQYIDNKIIEFIELQIKDKFNSFIYGKIDN